MSNLSSHTVFEKQKRRYCFKVLDKEKKGYLESEELTKYLTQEGKEEAFRLQIHVTQIYLTTTLLFFNQVSRLVRRRWTRC